MRKNVNISNLITFIYLKLFYTYKDIKNLKAAIKNEFRKLLSEKNLEINKRNI